MLDIPHLRLYNQHISRQDFHEPHEILAWSGVMQGQDYTGAKWSIGLRLPACTDAKIEQAIEQKTILRSWLLRGTLHFVAAQDIYWLTELIGSRQIASNARRYRELELDEQTLSRSNEILVRTLQNHPQVQRTALFEILEQSGISTRGQRGYYLLHHASLSGLICQGTAPKNESYFMLMPEFKTLPHDMALAELAKRYFTSHGPATLPDFTWWSGLPAADARAGFEAVKSQFVSETVDQHTYWMSPITQSLPNKSHEMYLLAGFDEYLLGYKDRSAVLAPQHAQKVVPGGNGVFFPTIVVNGQVVGTWKRTLKKETLTLAPTLFENLSEIELQIFTTQAEKYARFLEVTLNM